MTTYADSIAAAAAQSRAQNEIVTVEYADIESALDELFAEVAEGEESDYVRNGDVLEFWCFAPDSGDDEMTMRVHVVSA